MLCYVMITSLVYGKRNMFCGHRSLDIGIQIQRICCFEIVCNPYLK